MDVTPEEFVNRLLSEEAHSKPSDNCQASELDLQLPPWYDENKFKVGQKFNKDNLYGIAAAQIIGLITIISVPSILEVLVHTKRSSSSFTAYRRYVSTYMHAHSWSTEELKPGSKSWKSLLAVRTRHLKAGKNARTVGAGTVSQRDLALTQFGFVGHLLLYPDHFGIQSFNKHSWEGFVHLWKTILHLLGLEDKYNLCVGTVEESTEICSLLMERVFSPLLEFPPEPFEHMAYVILDGLWSMLPLSYPKVGLYTVRMLAGVPGYVYTEQSLKEFRQKIVKGEITRGVKPAGNGWHKTLPRKEYKVEDYYLLSDVPEYRNFSFTDRIIFGTNYFLLKVYSTYIGKIILNLVIQFFVMLAYYFPVLAFARFGFGTSFVNMFEESISDRTKPLSNSEVIELLNRPPWYCRINLFKST